MPTNQQDMSIPVRLNDKQNPAREEQLKELSRRFRVSPPDVIRGLIDAYFQYIEEHGVPPAFPLEIKSKPTDKKP